MQIDMETFEQTLTRRATCLICKKVEYVTVKVKDWDRYVHQGLAVQDVWPDMSADERELIISSQMPTPCSVCWDKYMRCEEDE